MTPVFGDPGWERYLVGWVPEFWDTRPRATHYCAYNFAVAPPIHRNTFASPTVVSRPPAVVVSTAGAAPETNKWIGVSLQQFDEAHGQGGLNGPNTNMKGDFRHSFRAMVGARCSDSALLSDTAFVSLGWGSWARNTPPVTTADSGYFKVHMSLRYPGQWWCTSQQGDVTGLQEKSAVVTLPNLSGNPLSAQGGEMVEVQLDPYSATCKAWVRGVLIAEFAGLDFYPGSYSGDQIQPSPTIELGIFSGVQTGAVRIDAVCAGLIVQDYGTFICGAEV